MDIRGLIILGAPTQRAYQMVGGVCLTAMEELDYRSTRLAVEISHDPQNRPGIEASTSAAGIHLSPNLLGNVVRLVWILSEEIAHAYLREVHSVPNGGGFADRFAQEGFASWFQTSRCINGGLVSPADINTTPISDSARTPRFGGELGKHIGSAHGGSTGNVEQLEDWLRETNDEPLQAYVRDLLTRLPRRRSPSEMATFVTGERTSATTRC